MRPVNTGGGAEGQDELDFGPTDLAVPVGHPNKMLVDNWIC